MCMKNCVFGTRRGDSRISRKYAFLREEGGTISIVTEGACVNYGLHSPSVISDASSLPDGA